MTEGDEQRRARFEALAHEVWTPVQRYLARRAAPADAEDLLSDVLLVLWRRLDDVPRDNPLPWTYRVAQGCLANSRRGQQRHLNLVRRLRDEPPLRPSEDEPLAEALQQLRPEDREVLRLWAWEGLEPRDLAVVLGCTANAAAVRVSRARSALRAQLGKDPAGAGQMQGREEEVTGR